MTGKYTVDDKDNKGDKTREEAKMTVFPKSSKVVQIHISGVFYCYPFFGSLLDRFGHFWKKRAKGRPQCTCLPQCSPSNIKVSHRIESRNAVEKKLLVK